MTCLDSDLLKTASLCSETHGETVQPSVVFNHDRELMGTPSASLQIRIQFLKPAAWFPIDYRKVIKIESRSLIRRE
jgi:hypothetical protein